MKSCYPKRATSLPMSLNRTTPAGIPKSLQSDLKVEAFIRTSWSAKRIDPSTPCSQTREDSSPNPSLSSHATTSATLHSKHPTKKKRRGQKRKLVVKERGKNKKKVGRFSDRRIEEVERNEIYEWEGWWKGRTEDKKEERQKEKRRRKSRTIEAKLLSEMGANLLGIQFIWINQSGNQGAILA